MLSIFNRRFNTISINNIFKKVMPSPIGLISSEIVFSKDLSKTQIKWFKSYLLSLSTFTSVRLHILSDCTETLKKLNNCLLRLSICHIKLRNISIADDSDVIQNWYISKLLIQLIQKQWLTSIDFPNGLWLRNLCNLRKASIIESLQCNWIQNIHRYIGKKK